MSVNEIHREKPEIIFGLRSQLFLLPEEAPSVQHQRGPQTIAAHSNTHQDSG